MDWTEVVELPELRNLQFKIETNRYGQLVMSPASNRHSMYQGAIYAQLLKFEPIGYPHFECAIKTREGVKVADVAWYSADFLSAHGNELVVFTSAPEICVEVLSPSNSLAEIDEKTRLYFEHGALEVWICNEAGNMKFMNPIHQIEHSELLPEFPTHIQIRI